MRVNIIPPYKNVDLLADEIPGKKYNRWSFLGRELHDFSKWMIRAAIDRIHGRMKPAINLKLQKGWNSPANALLYEDFNWLIALDKNDKFAERFKMLAGQKNARLFEQTRDIFLTQIDEDTFYNIRFWLLMYRMHNSKRWPLYEQAMNQANAIFSTARVYNPKTFAEIYDDLNQGKDEQLPVEKYGVDF